VKKHVLYIAAAFAAAVSIIFIWLMDFPSWKSLDMEKLRNPDPTTIIYDSQNQPAAGMHSGENRLTVPLADIPIHVRNAFVAIEDARFYEHCGVDLWRIGGALLNNLRAGGYAEGASTITQQLIKLTHLTSEKTLSRKAQEAWLAMQLERTASKDEILEMYLNTVYFGKGAYGIEAASQSYFGKSCSQLTLPEGALLAGVIKAPGNYAPHISPEKAKERRNLVIDAMLREGMIDAEDAAASKQATIILTETADLSAGGNWYVDWVLREAAMVLDLNVEEILSGGYHIYTSLNTVLQKSAEALYAEGDYFPGNASDGIRPESALVALAPESGEVLCMIGGRSYDARFTLNRACQMKRQPGSAFKPISVYAAAVDHLGYTPVTMIDDTANEYAGYTPANASGKEYGTVTLRQALARSMNLASVNLLTRTGIKTAIAYAKRAGLTLNPSDSNLALALGSLTDGVSPAELSAAYAPLVNGGHQVTAHTVRTIKDSYGQVLYEYTAGSSHVMDEKSARMITDMLKDAVVFGTAKQLSGVGFPLAAKTGTVGNADGGNRDAWTVAYTPGVVLTVWMGFDHPDDSHLLPEGITGGTYPARLAAAFLKDNSDIADGGEFPIPEGMSSVLIDAKALEIYGTPMLAGENTPSQHLLHEILPDSKLPMMTSDLWNEPKGIESLYIAASTAGKPVISFIITDRHSDYRIIRKNGETQTAVGTVSGNAGEYISFTDEEFHGSSAEYCVIARHRLFAEEGVVIESTPSEWKPYHAPGLIERIYIRQESDEPSAGEALFAE